jgi:hypothetical protein
VAAALTAIPTAKRSDDIASVISISDAGSVDLKVIAYTG